MGKIDKDIDDTEKRIKDLLSQCDETLIKSLEARIENEMNNIDKLNAAMRELNKKMQDCER